MNSLLIINYQVFVILDDKSYSIAYLFDLCILIIHFVHTNNTFCALISNNTKVRTQYIVDSPYKAFSEITLTD